MTRLLLAYFSTFVSFHRQPIQSLRDKIIGRQAAAAAGVVCGYLSR